MTKTVTLNLTLEELKTLDKYVELNDETRPLFDKIRNAYPKPTTLFDVIRNLGYSIDMCYEIVDAVEEFEKSKEKEMIKRNLKTSLQELVNGDVRPIDDVVRETKNQQIKELVRESVKWCEEHREESVEDYLKPKTPEQVADGLKEAFREAVKQGVVSSSNKPQTLYDLIAEWWEYLEDTLDMDSSIKDLVNDIEEWLPKEQSAAGSQNAYVECSVEGFNDCLNKIRRKLR